MAGRIINATLTMAPIQRTDKSLLILFGRGPDSFKDDDIIHTTWALDAWPARSGHVADGTDQGNWPMSNRCVWVEDIRWSGVSSFIYRITGYVLDSLGQPVSGARVRMFATADDSFVAETLSDEAGQYSFGAPDATTQFYVVAYRPAPPISGASVHTLVGAL
jgi:hypothetical protein